MTLRLRMYAKKPFSMCLLCKKWFPHAYLNNALAFLHEDEADLDVGFSLPFRALATKEPRAHDMAAVAWLAPAPVQGFLEDVCLKLFVNSLPAERRAAEAKGWAARKITPHQHSFPRADMRAIPQI